MDISEKKYKLKTAITHKGRLHYEESMPKITEDPKRTVFINTENSSEIMRYVLSEFYTTRKTFSIRLNKKNKVECAFEDTKSVEYFSKKTDASFFLYTTDSKKRPMNLVAGVLFDNKPLDIFEFEVKNFIPKEYMKANLEFEFNSQPIIIFQGELFETDKELERTKKFFLDFYTQDLIEEVNITDLRRVIVFAVDSDKTIKIRNYQTNPLSEYSLKNINLEETGPSFDLVPRRVKLCDDDEYKSACKQPKLISKEKFKNKVNSMLDIKGKLYTNKQNLQAASLKRYDRLLSRKRKTNKEVLEKNESEAN
jgi:ribosome production factor 2